MISEINFTAPGALLTPQDTAEILGVDVRSLSNWRVIGKGPRYCRLSGRSIKYPVEEVEAYIRKSIRSSTSDTGSEDELCL